MGIQALVQFILIFTPIGERTFFNRRANWRADIVGMLIGERIGERNDMFCIDILHKLVSELSSD